MTVSHAAQHAAFLQAMDHFQTGLTKDMVSDRNQFIKAAAKRYEEHRTINFSDLVHKHQDQVFATLKANYKKIIPAFGALAISAIRTKQMKSDDEDDLFADLADTWIHTQGLKRSKLIADTSEADVLGVISSGFDDGLARM